MTTLQSPYDLSAVSARQSLVKRFFAFHYYLLLITYKSQKASLVKSEEVISKPQRPTPLGLWQRYKDSNLNKRSQSPVCYRYTIPLYAASSYYCPLTNILYPIITVCQAKIKKIFWKQIFLYCNYAIFIILGANRQFDMFSFAPSIIFFYCCFV